jgi:hypothetical protein
VIHLGIMLDIPGNLSVLRLYFDVNDGTFGSDYYVAETTVICDLARAANVEHWRSECRQRSACPQSLNIKR